MAGRRSAPDGRGGRALGARLRRVSDRIDADSARIYAAMGIRFEQRWFGLIDQLASNGPMSVGDIAKALRISHASVSQARSSLETSGLVVSIADDRDARRKVMQLTEAGTTLVARMTPLWRVFEEVASDLDRWSGGIVTLLDHLEALLDDSSLFERITDRASGLGEPQ